MLRRKTVSVRAAAVVAAALVSSQVFAAELFWNTGVTGDFTNTANYTGTPTPPAAGTGPYKGTGDFFDIGGGGTANYPGTVPIATVPTWDPSRLRIGHNLTNGGAGTLNMTDGAITPGGNGGTGANGTTAGLVVGLNADGILNLSGGTITSTRFIVIGSDGTSDNTGNVVATGTLNLSGGTIRSSNENFLIGGGNAGIVNITGGNLLVENPGTSSTAAVADLWVGNTVASTYTQSAGTVRVSRSFFIDHGSTVTVSGGTIDTETKKLNAMAPPNQGHAAGNFIVGRAGSANETFNLSGSAIVNVGHRFLMGSVTNATTGDGSTNAVTNQSGGTLNVDLNMSISDVAGSSTYNFSGGTINTGFDYDANSNTYGIVGDAMEETNPGFTRIGRRGVGVFNHTGGVANFGTGLAMGDDDGSTGIGSTGTYEISAGEMHTQLLPTQTGATLRIGTAGTGTFRVVGDDAVVDVNGSMAVDNTAKGLGTLAYKFEAGDGLSVIDVSGTATFSSGAALSLDTSASAPTQRVSDVLTAASIVDNGIAITNGWAYQVINGGANGKLLQVAQIGTLYWDTDSANPGAGGASPAGTWDAASTNFTSDASGSTTTSAVSTIFADDVVFAAGADGTGSYTVTVNGTQAARSVQVPRGDVTFAGGAINTPKFDVAAGASAAVNSMLSQNLTKTGAGTLALGAANTMTSTTVSAGTLVAAHGDAFGGGAVNVADGAVVQAQASLPKAVTVTTLNTNTSGKFDVTNNSMVVKGMTDAQVRTQLQAGYNGGGWNGATGIVSSAVNSSTSVGYASNTSLGLTEFKGVSGLTGTDVIVKYTYAGDANLDGKVDIGDLGLLAGAWQQLTDKVWFDGDFTYDGAVNIGDLGLLAGNWQKGTAGNPNGPLMTFDEAMAQFAAFDGVAVPEPASLSLLALGGLGLLARRRRANRR